MILLGMVHFFIPEQIYTKVPILYYDEEEMMEMLELGVKVMKMTH